MEIWSCLLINFLNQSNMINKGKFIKTIYIILISTQVIFGQSLTSNHANANTLNLVVNDTIKYLNIPKRSEDATSGSELAKQVNGLNIFDREKTFVKEILSGNIPSFSRKLKPLKVTEVINGKSHELIFFTSLDYLAIGSDEDYLYIPITPSTAQYLADKMNTFLPTKKIVDIIYNKAEVKLKPQPIPPSNKMTTVPVFKQHTDSIKTQVKQMKLDRLADNIISGHKKDVIISNKINKENELDRVVIYGWHLAKNNPIQPVYNGHNGLYADYSHGIRLVSKFAFINGKPILINDILKDRNLSTLLSNEGVIIKPNYPKK